VRILITGAAGFVAGHLVNRLAQIPGAQIFGLSLGPDPALPSFEFFDCDIRNGDAVSSIIRSVRPSHICHLAAISSVAQATADQDISFAVNVLGTRNVLEAAAGLDQQPTVLNISTGQVYDTTSMPLTETSSLRPPNVYAATKAMAELWAELYRDRIDWINVRAFNHTGPGQAPIFALASWTQRIASIMNNQSEPVIHVGDLSVERDFTDVRDVVEAYALLLQQGPTWETYNVCSGIAVRLSDIMALLLDISGVKAEIIVDKSRLRKADAPKIVGSNAKLQAAVNWQPRTPLRKTLRDMLQYWQSRTGTEKQQAIGR
jgi:GDP-4-dehydro-6-deoxy-D-mannose reductase